MFARSGNRYAGTGHTSPRPNDGFVPECESFDGKTGALSLSSNVLVKGNRIEKISTAPIAFDKSALTEIIEGSGRTLMPGLIDAHTHIMMAAIPMQVAMTADIGTMAGDRG